MTAAFLPKQVFSSAARARDAAKPTVGMSRLDGILNSVAATHGQKSLRPERVRSSNRQDAGERLITQAVTNGKTLDGAEAEAGELRCPSCESVNCDIDSCHDCGAQQHSLDFQDDENRSFADEAEANAKKQRVTYTADTHLATGRVKKLGMAKVSAIVDAQARRDDGTGANAQWRLGLDRAVELLQGIQGGAPEIGQATVLTLHTKLNDVLKGLAIHQADPACHEHDPNCHFRKGRRFNQLCVGIAVVQSVLEQCRRVPDSTIEARVETRSLEVTPGPGHSRSLEVTRGPDVRKSLRQVKRMLDEAMRSLEQGRAACHYPALAPPPLARRTSPRLAEASGTGGSSAIAPKAASAPAQAAAPPASGAGPSAAPASTAPTLAKDMCPRGPENDLPRDIERLFHGKCNNNAVKQAMRLYASGTIRRIYSSGWLPKSHTVRAVALYLAHKHMCANRPDLRKLGLPTMFVQDKGKAYGAAAQAPKSFDLRRFVKQAETSGVADGAEEGSF